MTQLRPLLCLMTYGGVAPPMLDSLLKDLPADELAWTATVESGDAAIDRARSIAATKFLDTDCNVMVMLDHDVSWRPGDLGHLAQQALETQGIVGALVSKRALGQGIGGRLPVDCDLADSDRTLIELGEDYYVGGAVMAIHRPVFESLLPDFPMVSAGFRPFFLPMVKQRIADQELDYLSEDWAICARAREKGHPVHATTLPRIVHHGQFGYTVDGAFES